MLKFALTYCSLAVLMSITLCICILVISSTIVTIKKQFNNQDNEESK